VKPPPQDGAGERVRRQAAVLAAGTPILADGLHAERLALDGQRVWIANPLDAFARSDQRLYLDWLDARPAGDSLLDEAGGSVVLVTRASPPQRRLERDPAFRSVARDSEAVVYLRTGRVEGVQRVLVTRRQQPRG